jgi:hypothetical protein
MSQATSSKSHCAGNMGQDINRIETSPVCQQKIKGTNCKQKTTDCRRLNLIFLTANAQGTSRAYPVRSPWRGDVHLRGHASADTSNLSPIEKWLQEPVEEQPWNGIAEVYAGRTRLPEKAGAHF